MNNSEEVFLNMENAAKALLDTFAEAANMKTGETGAFFLDYMPPVINAAALFFGGGTDVVPFLQDLPPEELNVEWELQARFENRKDAVRFAASVFGVLPIKQLPADGPLRVVQPIQLPVIQGKYTQLRQDEPPVLLFHVEEMRGRCVFNTGLED